MSAMSDNVRTKQKIVVRLAWRQLRIRWISYPKRISPVMIPA